MGKLSYFWTDTIELGEQLMSILGERYIVKQGDSLWKISEKKLGDPFKWRAIYNHNNRNEVIVATKTKIKDPDFIFVGQEIYIPDNLHKTGENNVKRSNAIYTPSHAGRKVAYDKVKGVPFKFNLEKLDPVTKDFPTYISTIKLLGVVTIQTKETLDFITITQEGFEASAKNEAKSVLGKLTSESKVGFNNTTKEISFECGMTMQANCKSAPVVGTAIGISSNTGLPALKASIKFPPFQGEISTHFFASNDFTAELEVTPKTPATAPGPVPSALNIPQPATVPSALDSPKVAPNLSENRFVKGWVYYEGITFIVGSLIVVGATLGEDIATFGVGLWNDIPSFATAAGMFAIGYNKLRNGSEETQKTN